MNRTSTASIWKIGLCVLLSIVSLVLGSCDKGTNNPLTPNSPGSSLLFVLNTLGQTLSVVNLDSNTVTQNVATLEQYPNQVVCDSGKVFAVNSGTATVQIFNANDYSVVGKILVGDGTNPMCVAISGNKAYITCLLTDEVKLADLSTRQIIKSIHVGHGPTGILIANGKAYATNTNLTIAGQTVAYGPGSVSVIDCTTDMLIDSIAVGLDPQALAIGPDGYVHVVCTGDYGAVQGSISVINQTSRLVVATIPIGGAPGAIAFSRSGIAYVGATSGTGVARYDGKTFAIIDSSSHPLLGRGGSAVAADARGYVYVAVFSTDLVLKLDNSGAVVATYPVGSGPQSIAIR